MLKSFTFRFILLPFIFLLVVSGCKDSPSAPQVDPPVITTETVGNMTPSTAILTGTVQSDGGSSVVDRGVCYAMTTKPTKKNDCASSGVGLGEFTVTLTGLKTGTTYHVRAYATNGSTTGYSAEVSFTTTGVTDIDGNVYPTVLNGNRNWMAANLKTTRYRDGSLIEHMSDDAEWSGLHTTGAWANYDNDSDNDGIYGKLYNWYAVFDNRGLCPVGWSVPTKEDWETLSTLVGIDPGFKMKSTEGWNENGNGSNSSGFNGLPGGYRSPTGSFHHAGIIGRFWSSTQIGINPIFWELQSFGRGLYSSPEHLRNGKSIRCIKALF